MPNNPASSALDRVTRFTLESTAADIPAKTLHTAACLLLDTLGICAASAPMEAGQLGRNIAARLFAAGNAEDSARFLFDGRQASMAGAVFAAATQIDNLDGHDGYNPTKGHIGVAAVPALVVLSNAKPDLSGPDALAALVAGYEVAGRAGISLHASVSDYHTSGAWNALGVTAIAARLRGHTAEQLRHGLGIAEYHGPRSQMMREIATPTMLHDGSGWGALAGITAAIAAEEGFTGAPAVTLEAPEAETHWEDLGHFWQVDHQYIKPYPVCRWAHAAIDAAHELSVQHKIAATDITEIRIRSFNNAIALFPGIPETTSQAQYSLPFVVATVIIHGRVGLEHISGEGLKNQEIASLVSRTRLSAEPKHEVRYPVGRWADVEIELNDGRILASGDVHARGGPERPFSEDDIIAKFNEFAAPVLGEERAQSVLISVLGLTEPDSKFKDVVSHLYDPL